MSKYRLAFQLVFSRLWLRAPGRHSAQPGVTLEAGLVHSAQYKLVFVQHHTILRERAGLLGHPYSHVHIVLRYVYRFATFKRDACCRCNRRGSSKCTRPIMSTEGGLPWHRKHVYSEGTYSEGHRTAACVQHTSPYWCILVTAQVAPGRQAGIAGDAIWKAEHKGTFTLSAP